MAADVTFDLSRMTPGARAMWLDVYALGYRDGVEAGRRQLDDEYRGRWEVSAAIARQVAEAGSYDELEERRGRPDRAALHRELMVGRGVVA